ncbi:hypothetical protein [Cyclobacterium qasimii]|uniref:Uncharacterized protein n=1 Tax=Cyclobacterium qasimii TaxID=1350429 RepID=A0A512CH21_9BACT|nr:hypothetical protein [Cyclobacterium qasimii]GEO23492.1 hypothetical protein CQA01_40260 [Cyclobacterium qasimii]
MKGEDHLKKVIGRTLEDGRLQSFYLKGELVDRINVTFLKIGDCWLRVVSTDEMTNVKIEEDAIDEIEFYGDNEFKYPIELIDKHFPEFKKYIGKKLLDFKELVLKEAESMSFGINLYFEDNLNWVIHNQDYPIDRNVYYFNNKIPEDLKEK